MVSTKPALFGGMGQDLDEIFDIAGHGFSEAAKDGEADRIATYFDGLMAGTSSVHAAPAGAGPVQDDTPAKGTGNSLWQDVRFATSRMMPPETDVSLAPLVDPETLALVTPVADEAAVPTRQSQLFRHLNLYFMYQRSEFSAMLDMTAALLAQNPHDIFALSARTSALRGLGRKTEAHQLEKSYYEDTGVEIPEFVGPENNYSSN